MRYWLMKSEPDVYGIEDLRAEGTDHWDGVRNYQARNFMRDDMQVGDRVLFYHSNAKPPGVAGLAEIAKPGYPDHTAWDPEQKYYDPKSSPDAPRWFMVDLRWIATWDNLVPLDRLRDEPRLADMALLNRSRLSVQPVTDDEFEVIMEIAGESWPS